MENPRRTAVRMLIAQEKNGYSNLILSGALSNSTLNSRDKSFVSVVFYGVIERLNTLDYILSKFLSKPLSKMDHQVRAILRSGAYQCLYMDSVPTSAAINESVTLTKKMGKTSASGMVNAVLRKVSDFDLSKEEFRDKIEEYSIAYSVSKEIAQLAVNEYGDNAQDFLKASFNRIPLCIRVNTLKTNSDAIIENFEKEHIKAEKTFTPDSVFLQYRGDITSQKYFRNGFLHVQGEGSALACRALNPKKGSKVIDLCAAPGGKSATLSQYMENKGELFVCDLSQGRLELAKTLIDRLGITCCKYIVGDGTVYNEKLENADYVLCDVPCSGVGIISKKPDIRYKNLENIENLIQIQKNILNQGSKYLKKGGRLVYSTCTVNSGENEAVVLDFLENNSDFTFGTLPDMPQGTIIKEGMARFDPHLTGTDGFFIAILEKK